MKRAFGLLGSVLVVGLAMACGSNDSPAKACTPGQSVACVGAGGCSGGQVCSSDGSGFGACICGGSDAGLGDGGADVEAGPKYTTGNPCSKDGDCTGPNEKCSSDALAPDTFNPTPICVSVGCTPSATAPTCNAGTGACGTVSTGITLCSGKCTFDGTSGGAPAGCGGKNLCRYAGYTLDAQKVVSGVGACIGGCQGDGDCSAGKCQIDTGECVATLVVRTKKPGDACNVGDTTCNCATPSKGTASYCTQFCVVGGSACPTGFSCEAGLPTTDGTNTLFTKSPAGMAGQCLKNCSVQTDCSAVNATCDVWAGSGKVCHPGK